MKKVLALTAVYAIFLVGVISATCSCFSDDSSQNDEPEYSKQSAFFLKTLERYRDIYKKHNFQEAQKLVGEALHFFEKNMVVSGNGQKSCSILLYEYLQKYAMNENISKVIKFYLFTLDYIAMNPTLSDIEAIIVISCCFFIDMNSNLNHVVFCYDKQLMPTMKFIDGSAEKKQGDIYDTAEIKLLQINKYLHQKKSSSIKGGGICSCFSGDCTTDEIPLNGGHGYSKQSALFLKTFDRYRAMHKKNDFQETQNLVTEALAFFKKNIIISEKETISCSKLLYEYLEKYVLTYKFSKIIKFYLFALDFIAMNKNYTEQKAVASIAYCFIVNMEANLDNVVFCWNNNWMPYMNHRDKDKEKTDVYDANDFRLEPKLKAYPRESPVDSAPSSQP